MILSARSSVADRVPRFLIPLAALFAGACVRHYEVPAPERGIAGIPPVPDSVATVPVQVDLSAVVADLTKSIRNPLDAGKETMTLDTHVAPQGAGGLLSLVPAKLSVEVTHEVTLVDLDLEMRGTVLTISVTADAMIDAKVAGGAIKTDLASCGVHEPRARLRLTVSGTVSIGSDASLAFHRQSDAVEWLRPCNLTALNVSAESLLKLPGIRTIVSEQISAALDRAPTSFSFRPMLEKVWRKAAEPIRITDERWLSIEPTGLAVTQPTGQGKVVSIVVSLTARPNVVEGRAAMNAPARPFPGVGLEVPARARFAVQVPATMVIAEVNKRLRSALVGKHQVAGHALAIDQVTLYGKGDGRAVIAVTVSSPVSLVLYLEGTPVFDRENNVIAVSGLDYTAETRNVVLQAADFLLHDTLRARIQAAARFEASSVRRKAEAALANLHFKGTGYDVALKTESIRVTGISVSEREIMAAVAAEGTATITVDPR
jgi:hypothetical protein